MEAVSWHQLGIVFHQAGQWDEAERCYRESARIAEWQGNLVRAAETWYNLARVNESSGRFQAAEDWYRKAQKTRQQVGDMVGSAKTLHSLANLLQHQPNRLDEARQLAEKSLAIQQTLEPGATEIWKIYTLLAQIAGKQNDSDRARAYHRQARAAYRNFAGRRHELQQYAWLIDDVVATVFQPQRQPELESGLASAEQKGWTDLAAAIRHILNGERDAATLCDTLDLEDSMIVEAILEGIDDPASLEALLGTDAV
jgi:tetratricopeptide (TPR) repeat protein